MGVGQGLSPGSAVPKATLVKQLGLEQAGPGAVPDELCTQGSLFQAAEVGVGLGSRQSLGSTVPRHHGGVPGAVVDPGWRQSLGSGHLDRMAGAGVGV